MDDNWKAGLEDVIAARSAICTIDGGRAGSSTGATRSASWPGR